MAINISKKQKKLAEKNFYFLPEILFDKRLIILKKIFIRFVTYQKKIHNLINLTLKNLILLYSRNYRSSNYNITSCDFANFSDQFIINNWFFCPEFLDQVSYSYLLKNWPSKFFFKSRLQVEKNYQTGMEHYTFNDKKEYSRDIKHNKFFLDFYTYLESAEFKKKLFNLQKGEKKYDYELFSIIASNSYPGSFLAPHKDSIAAYDEKKDTMINCIFFVDGNNQDTEFSGATGLYEDNNFEKKIFLPNNLKNTLLVYNSTSNFFHGFQFLKKGNFRKAITFQFKKILNNNIN